MDAPSRLAGNTGVGLLDPFISGADFAVALQDGLSRSLSVRSPGAAASTRRFASPDGDVAVSADDPPPADTLLPVESAAILRRFERALADLGLREDSADDEFPLHLPDFARRVLRSAEEGPREATAQAEEHSSPATALLMECALLYVLESGARDTDAALRGAAGLTRPSAGPCPGRATSRAMAGGTSVAAARPVREALGQARRLVGGLRDRTAVPPLRDAVREFAEQAAPGSIEVTVTTTGDESKVPGPWRREVFLVVRECLRNVFEHAGASRVTVAARVTRRWLYVRVEDDGSGFPRKERAFTGDPTTVEARGASCARKSSPPASGNPSRVEDRRARQAGHPRGGAPLNSSPRIHSVLEPVRGMFCACVVRAARATAHRRFSEWSTCVCGPSSS